MAAVFSIVRTPFASVTTFAVTTWYVSYANRELDPIAAEIRDEIETGATFTAEEATR